MSTPTETAHKSSSRISERTGIKAGVASIIGFGLLPFAQAFEPKATLPLIMLTSVVYIVALFGLRRPLDPTNLPKNVLP